MHLPLSNDEIKAEFLIIRVENLLKIFSISCLEIQLIKSELGEAIYTNKAFLKKGSLSG